MVMILMTIKVMVMVTVVMVSACSGTPICRPRVDHGQTKWRLRKGVGPSRVHPLPDFHLAHTCSTHVLQIGFPRQLLTITTFTIMIPIVTYSITQLRSQMNFL